METWVPSAAPLETAGPEPQKDATPERTRTRRETKAPKGPAVRAAKAPKVQRVRCPLCRQDIERSLYVGHVHDHLEGLTP